MSSAWVGVAEADKPLDVRIGEALRASAAKSGLAVTMTVAVTVTVTLTQARR